MDLLTRLAGDSVWFVSTTAASLDVTVILVSLLTFAICAGLAVLLFSFFKEQSFEDGLKASRVRTEDKETRRKQQEEKEAAKQRANQLKKARKANKKTESATNIDVDVPQEPAKKQQEDDNIQSSTKDIAISKRKKRRRLKGLLAQNPDQENEVSPSHLPSNCVNDQLIYNCSDEHENNLEDSNVDVDETQENLINEPETNDTIYQEDVRQEQTQVHGPSVTKASTLKNEEEPEYHGDSSSATATPEPVSKRQGKPSNNDQYAKVIKSEAPVVDQVTEEKEEELGTKKVKKMVIEEVEMPVISNEVTQMTGLAEQPISAQENPSEEVSSFVNAQQGEQQQPSPRKNRKPKAPKGPVLIGSKGPQALSAHELVTAVKSIPLEATETQTMIDILLNRQLEFGGVSTSHNGWVEPGSQKNKIDQLERDLSNRNSELDEERGKLKSITDRLSHVRRELNEEKTNHINARRAVDELQARHNQKAQALEARLQQEIDQHNRDVQHFQQQVQYHIGHSAQLQANLEAAAATAAESQQRLAQQPDPSAVLAELEQLRQYKVQKDSEVQNLHNQLSRKQGELTTLQTELTASSSRAGEVEGEKEVVSAELQKAKETTKSLQDKCDRLEKESAENDNQRKNESDKTTELDNKVEQLQLEKRNLEEKLADHENVLQSKITEINKLTEENEILSKKQMSNEETGASSNICNGVQNGEAEHEDTKLLSQKLSIANEEKEKVSQEKDSIVKQMTEEIEDYKNQLQSVSNELKTQKDKNDERLELETKVKKEEEESQKAFLARLFDGAIDVKDTSFGDKAHSEWLDIFEEKVKMWKTEAKESTVEPEAKDDPNEESIEQLTGQVEHYKGVLAETEKMLHQLQSTVETEESRWKSRLSEKEGELEQVRKETEKLTKSNLALEESLKVVNSAEEVLLEMEEKLQELQNKLADEESERKAMSISMSEMTDKQSAEKSILIKDMESLKDTLETEKRGRSDLEGKVAQMNQIISTAQEALQQEQKTVELLRQQVPKIDKPAESPSLNSVNGINKQEEGDKTEESKQTEVL